jgi:magnesium transporter
MISVCDRLERTEVIAISNSMRPHFRDVTDHVRHIEESIKTLREVLEFTHEANVMHAQMEQTYITRRLAAWAAILAVPTAIAGIYGMNFEHMPELKWEYGYFGVLLIIGITCIWLYSRFKSKGWI